MWLLHKDSAVVIPNTLLRYSKHAQQVVSVFFLYLRSGTETSRIS